MEFVRDTEGDEMYVLIGNESALWADPDDESNVYTYDHESAKKAAEQICLNGQTRVIACKLVPIAEAVPVVGPNGTIAIKWKSLDGT